MTTRFSRSFANLGCSRDLRTKDFGGHQTRVLAIVVIFLCFRVTMQATVGSGFQPWGQREIFTDTSPSGKFLSKIYAQLITQRDTFDKNKTKIDRDWSEILSCRYR